MAHKELYRSTENRVIAGVCGGIAERFDSDPLLIRLLFLFTIAAGGVSVAVYLILWIIIPEKGTDRTLGEEVSEIQEKYFKHKHMPHDHTPHDHDHHYHHRGSHGILGFLLILVGIVFLLDNLFPGTGLRTFWPLILIVVGLAIMLRHHDHMHEHERHHNHGDHNHSEDKE